MKGQIEPILYTDPQQVPHRLCGECGGAVYPPEYICIRCDRSWRR